jgi:hypothetical protein
MSDFKIKKLNNAMNALRQVDARMVQTNHHGKCDFWILPHGGRVDPAVARQVMDHPQVAGQKDALFPGMNQTWKLRRLSVVRNDS